jgi:ABC-2 type transport system ATP-binding protein
VFAIRLQDLTKDYEGGFWRRRASRALDHLTLDIETGTVLGFLGPNGAGKTTTLKLLMQLIYPTEGRAEILGRPAGDVEVRRRIGYLAESPYFYDNLTAEELLVYFASLFGFPRAERQRRADRLLDRVGIGAERRMPLRKFSKGMLQRVGIAQALINDPEVIFLDEPMSGLDPLGRRDVRALILALRDEGRTVFLSSHILSDAEALCSQVAIMARGRLVVQGRLTDLPFEVQGWEIVATGLDDVKLAELGPMLQQVTRVADGRYVIELPVTQPPEQVVTLLANHGAKVVSVNPNNETLEEFFVKQVTRQKSQPAAS